MTILVIYFSWERNERNTLTESIRSFSNYSYEKVYYLNVYWGIPSYITKLRFDVVIYHYSILAQKGVNSGERLFQNDFKLLNGIASLNIALPQDEYAYSDILCRFFLNQNITTVYTLAWPEDYGNLYPFEKSGVKYIFTTYAGYVDENTLNLLSGRLTNHHDRRIDLGYRARKNPFWLGSLGVLKWKITLKFLEYGKSIKLDISNDPKDVILGSKWYDFIMNCRCVLGVETGSSLHDPDGTIKYRVDKYCKDFPESEYDDVERNCFPGMDWNLNYASVSPRHFEACITKTCQVLVEGNYAGIFKPGVHYIEIKKDWSNIEDVITKIIDVEYCSQIADNAYNDIALSGKYTYKSFVNEVIKFSRENISELAVNDINLLGKLQRRDQHPIYTRPIFYLYTYLKSWLKNFLRKSGMLKYFVR